MYYFSGHTGYLSSFVRYKNQNSNLISRFHSVKLISLQFILSTFVGGVTFEETPIFKRTHSEQNIILEVNSLNLIFCSNRFE